MIRLPLGPEIAGLLLFFNKPATTDRMKSRRSERGEICTATWSLHAATVIIYIQFKNKKEQCKKDTKKNSYSSKTVANTIFFVELLAGIGL